MLYSTFFSISCEMQRKSIEECRRIGEKEKNATIVMPADDIHQVALEHLLLMAILDSICPCKRTIHNQSLGGETLDTSSSAKNSDDRRLPTMIEDGISTGLRPQASKRPVPVSFLHSSSRFQSTRSQSEKSAYSGNKVGQTEPSTYFKGEDSGIITDSDAGESVDPLEAW